MKMDELWQWVEREMELQDKMGKDFYHRLDRLIKLKEQEHVTRDSSYLKEQDKEQEKDQVNRDSSYLKEQKQDNRESSYIKEQDKEKEQFIGVFHKYTPQAPGAGTQSREQDLYPSKEQEQEHTKEDEEATKNRDHMDEQELEELNRSNCYQAQLAGGDEEQEQEQEHLKELEPLEDLELDRKGFNLYKELEEDDGDHADKQEVNRNKLPPTASSRL